MKPGAFSSRFGKLILKLFPLVFLSILFAFILLLLLRLVLILVAFFLLILSFTLMISFTISLQLLLRHLAVVFHF